LIQKTYFLRFDFPTFAGIKKRFMSFEITGKLVAKYDTVQRTETFRTREFVIEKTEDIGGRMITNYVKFQSVQDRTNLVDRYNIGDELKVSFNIKGTRWEKNGNVNYITNLDAWRVELLNNSVSQSAPASESYSGGPTDKAPDFVDDLPF
jgi:hypothetical protein